MPLLFLAAAAWALDGNDQLRLSLLGGQSVEGWYYSATSSSVVLSHDNRFMEVPLGLIIGASVNGEPRPVTGLLAELRQAATLNLEPPLGPSPWIAGTSSALWAGAGQAMLRDWKGAAAWSAVEIGLLGAGALAIHEEAGPGVLLPIVGLDLLFKGSSARDAARRSRARRHPPGAVPPDLIDR